MLTTVVGSYPVLLKEPSSLAEKIGALWGRYDPYKKAIEQAVSDQISAGIDIISDGQVRGDMIKIFAEHIPGMIVDKHVAKIINKINIPFYSIGTEDLKWAQKILNKTVQQLKLSEEEIVKKNIKGIVTGPTTMVYSSRIEGFYSRNQKEDAIMDMAQALKKEALELEKAGASIIQIDEPFLSTGVVDIPTSQKAVEIISKDLNIPVALHVCGNLEHIIDSILKFKVDIIDCEFAGIKENIQVLESISDFKGKKIGFGCVDTKKEAIEDIEDIRNLIQKGRDIIGEENMLIDPDCGMRMLSHQAAFSKLKNMVEASKWLI